MNGSAIVRAFSSPVHLSEVTGKRKATFHEKYISEVGQKGVVSVPQRFQAFAGAVLRGITFESLCERPYHMNAKQRSMFLFCMYVAISAK